MINLAQELFLLMSNLSQLKNQERIMTLFVEAISSFHPDFSVTYTDICDSERTDIEIRTAQNRFGYLAITGRPEIVSPEFWGLLQNSVQMLAVILENLKREQLLADENLKLNDLLRSVSNNLPSGMIYQVMRYNDGTRKFTYLSEGVRKFYGCSPEDAMNDASLIYGKIFEEDRDRVFSEEEQSNATFSTFSTETRMKNPSGSIRWSYFSSSPEKMEDGSTCWSGIEIDITERKEAAEQFRIMFDMALDMICIADINTAAFKKINPAFSRVLGYTQEELLHCPFLDFIHPDDVKKTVSLIENKLRKGIKVISFENRYRCKDGSYRYLDWTSHPLPEKGITFAIGHNITERKKAEEEIRKLNEDLEARVRTRTAQLEAANKELESFCYSVSHDLRSPLRGIDGWSLALAEDCADKLDKQGQKYLERIRAEALRMSNIIDDLLNLSRLTRSDMKIGYVNISELAEKIADNLMETKTDRRVEITIRPDMTAQADAGMMEIVLTNLIGNAWKFTGKTPEAKIGFGKLGSDDSGRQIFFIRDNGAGFDMTYSEKLFGAFQRLHKAREFPGTGIGLAIVQRIIHRHGGQVWAEGAVNHGATFYFTLMQSYCS